MKKIIVAALSATFIVVPAVAGSEPGYPSGSVGINYGIDHVLGIQGEFDISSLTDIESWSGQVFLKNYSQETSPSASWDTTGIGVAAIYDFNSVARLDENIHPYAGIGLISISNKWKGTGLSRTYTGASDWVYLVAGIRYPLAPNVDGDLNYNTFGDLTFGVNYSF